MGSDESHLNFPLSVRDKVTRQCPQTTTFLKRERDRGAEAESSRGLSAYQPNALPLGQTGSLLLLVECCFTSTETVGLLGTGAQDVHLHFHTAPELWFCPWWWWSVLLDVHRNRRLIRDGSPGRPPRLSHSSSLCTREVIIPVTRTQELCEQGRVLGSRTHAVTIEPRSCVTREVVLGLS